MRLLSQILLIYSWGAICLLLVFLLGIAQFFEQRLSEKSGEHRRVRLYRFFLVPIITFAVSAVLYAFSPPLLVGNLWADVLRIFGSFIFVYAGYALVSTMVGGKS